jgi:hypothetical protein
MSQIIIDGKKVGRIRAGYLLFIESWKYFKADPELAWFPLFALLLHLALLLVGVMFAILCFVAVSVISSENANVVWYVCFWMGMFYLLLSGAFVKACLEAGVAYIVAERTKGNNASLRDGVRAVRATKRTLLMWSLVAATVGVILNMIASRSRIIGNIVVALLGATWALLTYFTVQSIVLEGKHTKDAMYRSADVFKKTWGEQLVSNISIGIVFLGFFILSLIGAFVLFIFFSATGLPPNIAIGITFLMWLLVMIVLAVIQTVLNTIIKTLLFAYALQGRELTHMNAELLSQVLKKTAPASPSSQPFVAPPQSFV